MSKNDDSLDAFVRRGQAAQAAVDALSPEDQALLTALHEINDPQEFAGRLFEYYHDNDRADRTSRSQMYLHLGMCSGLILRAASHDARQAHALFSTLQTAELRDLLAAHRADMEAATAPETIAFCAGRMALIAAVLATRTEQP
jgi:hypothetical protein